MLQFTTHKIVPNTPRKNQYNVLLSPAMTREKDAYWLTMLGLDGEHSYVTSVYSWLRHYKGHTPLYMSFAERGNPRLYLLVYRCVDELQALVRVQKKLDKLNRALARQYKQAQG